MWLVAIRPQIGSIPITTEISFGQHCSQRSPARPANQEWDGRIQNSPSPALPSTSYFSQAYPSLKGQKAALFFFFFWPGWNPALSNSGFLNLGTVGIWNHVILCLERPMHYRMCGIIPGFYSLDANKLPPHCYDNQKCLQVLPNVLRVGWEGPQLL